MALPSLAAGTPGVVALVYLRGIMAHRDVAKADQLLTKWEDLRRQEVNDGQKNLRDDDPAEEFAPDCEEEGVTDDPPSADPAPPRAESGPDATPRAGSDPAPRDSGDLAPPQAGSSEEDEDAASLERKTKAARRQALQNIKPSFKPPEEPSDALQETYPREWHSRKPIQMRDLPSNLCVEREDKITYVLSSQGQIRLLFSQLLSVRRKAMESYFDLSSLDADHCYVPHQFQAPSAMH